MIYTNLCILLILLFVVFSIVVSVAEAQKIDVFADFSLVNNTKSDNIQEKLFELKFALHNYLSEPFNYIVTMGMDCLTKIKVLAFVKNRLNLEICNHLFDWMVPLNYTAFGKAIENNFDDVFGLDYLNVTFYQGFNVLKNEKYEFCFNHAFEGFNEVSHNPKASNILTNESFHKYFYLIESKFNHLVENSKKAVTTAKKTLYLVNAVSYRQGSVKPEDFLYFFRSIKSKRNNNFLLLVLISEKIAKMYSFKFDTIIEGNLIFHMMNEYTYGLWNSESSNRQWKEILDLLTSESA